MTDSHDIDRIIFLHLSGEADLEEIQELRKWLNADPLNKEVFENISKIWNHNYIELDATDKEEAFSLLQKRLKSGGKGEEQIKQINYYKSSSTNQRFNSFRLIAAIILFFIVAAVVVKFTMSQNVNEPNTQQVAQILKQNLIGQKSTIKLPDGSTVWLNAGSTISYPKIFGSDKRTIKLTGEAFFDIKKDEQRPFIVETGNLNISVLGTQFNVKVFPGESVSNVSLVSGKVKIENYEKGEQRASYILNPGEEISYNEVSGEIEKQNFDVEYVTGWKDGLLILKNDSFDSFVHKLRHWYGVEIEVEGRPNEDFIVTGKFQNENMENVLKTLQFSRNFEFTIKDNLLTLKFKNM